MISGRLRQVEQMAKVRSLCSCQGTGDTEAGEERKAERLEAKGRRRYRTLKKRFPVVMAKGFHLFPSRTQKLSPFHLFPSRTQKLSPSAPMVLGWTRPGRVGRRRIPREKGVSKLLFPIFLSSSMAEHSAVNRVVVGSSPTWGANTEKQGISTILCFFVLLDLWTTNLKSKHFVTLFIMLKHPESLMFQRLSGVLSCHKMSHRSA